MTDEIPAQVTDAGLEEWYASLSSQDKVRVRRYVGNIDTSSEVAFLQDLMSRAVDDHNYKLAVTAGEYLDSKDLTPSERFSCTELYIEGLFGADRFGEAKEMCYRNLDLYPEISTGEVPEKMSCRNRLIDILVGVDGEYDKAYELLDRYLDMGLIDREERDYRLQSLKVHRMQRSFDNIFNYQKAQRGPSRG